MFALPTAWTASKVADFVGGCTVAGRTDIAVEGIAPIADAGPGCLSFCSATEMASARTQVAKASPNSIILVASSLDWSGLSADRTLIIHPRPRYAFIKFASGTFSAADRIASGVSPLASVSGKAHIGKDVAIGPFTVIEDDARIGDGCQIGPQALIARGTHLGTGVMVQGRSTLGMVGTSNERDVDGSFIALPHLAGVRVGANCRIGASTTIARGTLRDTVIGEGSIIGSQVNIGHNCDIGRHCFIAAGAIMTGSSSLGDQSWLGPGAMLANRVCIGRDTIVAMGSVVVRDCGDGLYMAGNPARAVPHATRFNATGENN